MSLLSEYFNNLELRFPYIANNAVDFWIDNPREMVVVLHDGSRFMYDNLYHSIRRIPEDPYKLTKHECSKEFGLRLERILEQKHITQFELSERTGIQPSLISNYINGIKMPNFYNADKIAKALNCSLDEFSYTDKC